MAEKETFNWYVIVRLSSSSSSVCRRRCARIERVMWSLRQVELQLTAGHAPLTLARAAPTRARARARDRFRTRRAGFS